MLIEQDIFKLKVSVHTGGIVNVCHGADQLRKHLLHLLYRQRTILEEVIV
jgi:hypothetical protein